MNRCAENSKGNFVGASDDGYMVRLSADLCSTTKVVSGLNGI